MSAVAPPDLDRDQLLMTAARSPDVTARYRSHVVALEPEGCWWWTGAISSGGHGRFWVRRSVVVIAHRFGWLLAHPERALPDLLAHQCDNPLCQNPGHLHPSDPGDNRRQWAARRHVLGSPLRDTRGARTRALAVRAALLTGRSVPEAIAAGAPAVDVGQGVLWEDASGPAMPPLPGSTRPSSGRAACRSAAIVGPMSYAATVLRVMIASPSDVPAERDAVEHAIHGWNAANARAKGYILQPWRWESSAVPVMGGHPQALINSQGVDESDIVIAIFGSRLGSPTPEAASGTVSEIERATEHGKPVHLYFSGAPLPRDVDTAQLEGLRAFRNEMEQRGLLGEFSSVSQLEHEVWKAIEHDIAELGPAEEPRPHVPARVDLLVQPKSERELKGYTRQGKPRYNTRRWIEVTNRGAADAEWVTVESVGDSGLFLIPGGTPTVIHAGQTRTIPTFFEMGGSGDEPVVRVRWLVDGESFERDFHIG